MNKLIPILTSCAAMLASACDTMTTTTYDVDKANTLAEKVANGDEISQADYAEMIIQCDGAASLIEKRFDEILEIRKKGDAKKLQKALESLSDDDVMSAFENFRNLGTHLDTAALDSANTRRWEELKPHAQNIFAKSFEIFQ